MNLARRIEALEHAAGRKDEPIPDAVIQFIEPVQDGDGHMRPGRCVGGLRMISGKSNQWLDADMNPVATN